MELFVLVVLGFAAFAVFGLIAAAASLIGWVVALPFKLAAFAFKGLGVLLALPFLILFGLLGLGMFGAGLLVLMLPAIPFVLMVWLVFWLFRRRDRSHATPA